MVLGKQRNIASTESQRCGSVQYQLQGMCTRCSLVSILQELPVQTAPLQVGTCRYGVGVALRWNKDLSITA